jgi:ubiquitin carboxyl-terminal hydrolase 36/42
MHASKNLDSASKETTPFNQIFGGYMRQDVTCMRCKYVSTTFQHFMDILVDIRQVSTIEEALAQFFRQEKLGNSGDEASMYKCERCKVKVPAKRRCLIEKAPAVLCIQLKRFSLLGGKISKPVQLSRHLNIAPFIYPRDGGADNLPSVQYKLVSMITHVGPSPNCGHYTAIGEAGNGQFFQFDDASVRAIPLGQVLNTASYVVFYEMTRSSWAACIGTNTQQQKSAAVHPNSLLKESRPSSLSGSRNSLSSNGSGPSQGFRPKIISANGLSNKLGVVSAAAKHVAGAVADAARSVTNNIVKTNNGQASKAMGLVPYDDESSDEDTTAKASHSLPPQPAFVPRSVTVKTLSLKSQQSSCIGQKTVSATSGNWTVTDLDHHNPSVHSDNSTGSTNGGWVITSQNTSRPSSAMSEDTASNLSSKWTVTPLKRAIDETLPSKSQANGTSPSTPTSSASSSTSGTNTSSSLSSNNEKKRKAEEDHDRITRKRPSVDDQDGRDQTAPLDHYNAELDRGRTKKVKRQEISYNSSNGGGDGRSNPFQSQQNRHNQQKHHGRSSSASSSSSSGGRQHGHWDQDRNRSRDHHRDHNYHSSNHYYGKDKYYQRRRSYGGGESSSGGGGGGGDHRDKHHNSSSNRSFNRSFSSSNDGHRDSYRHWSSR